MSSIAIDTEIHKPEGQAGLRPHLDHPLDIRTIFIFLAILGGGLFFTAWSIWSDVNLSGTAMPSILPYLLLAVALIIALGFEFVNGFHDTANAVATVIYTRSLPAPAAVVWSGLFNFLGVLTSSGAVAFGILSLLPVELILQVGSSAGFAMVFALLIAAILWNLGTWWMGLPASSSHTMIGSIIGVGVANALLRGRDGTSGVDWGQATTVGYALLLSPLVGFLCSALLLYVMKWLVRKPALYTAPKDNNPPPLWIRSLLVLTCTGVSFFHGSNDGQKGMGLIMLILIGTVPTTYALNRAMAERDVAAFVQTAEQATSIVQSKVAGFSVIGTPDARQSLTEFVRNRSTFTDGTYLSLAKVMQSITDAVKPGSSYARVPNEMVNNTRNEMYLVSEALRNLPKVQDNQLSPDEAKVLASYKKGLDASTKFIPTWVKIAVAVALGLGTMIGWKRIVVTVGEKIGKDHLTYGQGAAAELVAMGTIFAADSFGLPVSTTHVLSSGVAGTMAANGSGIQWSTLGSIALAWVLTLPAAALLSGTLYFIFHAIF
eukprot:gene18328-18591_t